MISIYYTIIYRYNLFYYMSTLVFYLTFKYIIYLYYLFTLFILLKIPTNIQSTIYHGCTVIYIKIIFNHNMNYHTYINYYNF